MTQKDIQYCAELIKTGSLSFHAASKLLPRGVRDPALVLYAFCRLADDAVDLHTEKADAVLKLHERLDLAYAGHPRDTPVDRAFAGIVEQFDMPRALPEALLEGLAWDAMCRRYESLSELRAYSARVASAVGAMMCVLMRMRDRQALARACDLGVAMQLTNISRDVGEDARAGRLYLPLDWLREVGLTPQDFLQNAQAGAEIRLLVRRLLHEADGLYARSEAGVGLLPVSCRPGIFAARYIYAAIGGRIQRLGYDSVSYRARTNATQKLFWLSLSMLRAGSTTVMPSSALLYAEPLAETKFLVDAAAANEPQKPIWSDALYDTLSRLKEQDQTRSAALIASHPRPV
ncbi:MAG: phytoene/squalene synthase family protein [Pseudomonadota bacterium]